MTVTELIENRNKAWNAAKAFVETRRDKDGILSEEDAKTYTERAADSIKNDENAAIFLKTLAQRALVRVQ